MGTSFTANNVVKSLAASFDTQCYWACFATTDLNKPCIEVGPIQLDKNNLSQNNTLIAPHTT